MATPTIKNNYVGDGSTVLYSFTFPYIEVPDVKVTLDGTPTTEFIFANATTIQFLTAPANGAAITIYRETDNSDLKAVFFPGSAIRARDLNDNFTQSLYVVQEATIDVGDATTDAKEALEIANAANAKSDGALAAADQAAQDADSAEASAITAQNQAVAAEAAAAQAASDAAQASSDAAQAVSTANAADAKADEALAAVAAGPVVSVNGKTGVVVLTTNDVVDLTTLPTLPE